MKFIVGVLVTGGLLYLALVVLAAMPGWLLFIILGGLFVMGEKGRGKR